MQDIAVVTGKEGVWDSPDYRAKAVLELPDLQPILLWLTVPDRFLLQEFVAQLLELM